MSVLNFKISPISYIVNLSGFLGQHRHLIASSSQLKEQNKTVYKTGYKTVWVTYCSKLQSTVVSVHAYSYIQVAMHIVCQVSIFYSVK